MRLPATHRARSHADVLRGLSREARAVFTSAELVVRPPEGTEGRGRLREGRETLIGSAPNADVRVPSLPAFWARAAAVRSDGDRPLLVELTLLDGAAAPTTRTLTTGETARLGSSQVTLEVGPSWNPASVETTGALDLGRGVLDSVALALHVLWTYQQAWAEEGFLATARLPGSVAKLLGHLGYRGGPGAAATGLQHLRAKAGTRDVLLSAGFQVLSPPRDGQPAATFETLDPLRLDARLNELKAFMPPPRGPAAGSRFGRAPSRASGEPKAPASTSGLFGPGSAAQGLADRLEAQRHGPLRMRQAARARQDARHLASLVSRFGLDKMAACDDAVDSLCEKLCEAQKAAAEAGSGAGTPAPLSESQEILARQLRNLARRQADALAELECAIAQSPGEDPAAYAQRLDCLAAFLDAFVAGLIQEARDQMVLLRGPAALSNLDRAFGPDAGRAPARGFGVPGSDSLYLLPADDGQPPPVRPGDWLVVAEDVEQVAPDGSASRQRVHREAVRVLRVSRAVPEGTRQALARIHFAPALTRRYRLDDVVLLGNMARISEGATVVEQLTPGADARLVPLGHRPLTWLRDAAAPRGRRPEVRLSVAGRPWRRVDDLLACGPEEPVFAVEPLPAGGARLRVGDDESGASLPAGARVEATYRIGVGAAGDRDTRRLDGMGTAHPAVESTFNPLPTSGGADPEPTDLARARGPLSVGTLDRAVSVEDVEVLARDCDGVRRARVFRNPHRPRALTVVVAGPRGASLSDGSLRALRRYLADRVPPRIEVSVENRIVVPVRLRLLVRYLRGADPVALVQEVRARLGVEAHPDLPPGLLDPERVKLDDDLELSEVYAAVDGAAGLHSMVVMQLHRASEPAGLAERVVAGPRQLLVWAPPDPKFGDGVEIAYEEGRDL
jgi:Baseplate J-like protein